VPDDSARAALDPVPPVQPMLPLDVVVDEATPPPARSVVAAALAPWTAGAGAEGAAPERPEVEVRISTRRRKSAGAFWSEGKVVVVLPSAMPRAARPEMVEDLVRRVLHYRPHVAASDRDLAVRAAELADRYLDGVRPQSIRWVTNQGSQWGSCTFGSAAIRISDRLRVVPGWVLDAVLVHELAHLIEPNHSRRFRALANRYSRTGEADIFLEGFSLGREYARP
jgi:hypothetical protein